MRHFCLFLACAPLALCACGSSESTGPDAGGASGAAGGGAGGGAGDAGSGATGGSGASAGAGGSAGSAEIPCGSTLSCSGGDVCVEETFEPTNCSNLEDPDAECPDGQFQTFCGGAGGACCCDPPAPSTFKCDPANSCVGRVNCDCIACPGSKQCTSVSSEDSGVFRCEEPPKP